jgi:hypothetical protein
MYLNAKLYISAYNKETKDMKVSGLKGVLPPKEGAFNEMGRICNVVVNGIYWRKANAIHKWFVDNVQEGIDNCEMFSVGREDLIKLRDLCKKVMENKDKAKDLLPAHEGFFFGTYEYDQWYFDSVAQTVHEINLLLETFNEDWDFYYQSSW